ncbi:hypothetical protein HDV00_005421 [Rhizophlyctis rosea]|nr:hypothetical protein HDV00_005421 [Rhizophlyctis rosea]
MPEDPEAGATANECNDALGVTRTAGKCDKCKTPIKLATDSLGEVSKIDYSNSVVIFKVTEEDNEPTLDLKSHLRMTKREKAALVAKHDYLRPRFADSEVTMNKGPFENYEGVVRLPEVPEKYRLDKKLRVYTRRRLTEKQRRIIAKWSRLEYKMTPPTSFKQITRIIYCVADVGWMAAKMGVMHELPILEHVLRAINYQGDFGEFIREFNEKDFDRRRKYEYYRHRYKRLPFDVVESLGGGSVDGADEGDEEDEEDDEAEGEETVASEQIDEGGNSSSLANTAAIVSDIAADNREGGQGGGSSSTANAASITTPQQWNGGKIIDYCSFYRMHRRILLVVSERAKRLIIDVYYIDMAQWDALQKIPDAEERGNRQYVFLQRHYLMTAIINLAGHGMAANDVGPRPNFPGWKPLRKHYAVLFSLYIPKYDSWLSILSQKRDLGVRWVRLPRPVGPYAAEHCESVIPKLTLKSENSLRECRCRYHTVGDDVEHRVKTSWTSYCMNGNIVRNREAWVKLLAHMVQLSRESRNNAAMASHPFNVPICVRAIMKTCDLTPNDKAYIAVTEELRKQVKCAQNPGGERIGPSDGFDTPKYSLTDQEKHTEMVKAEKWDPNIRLLFDVCNHEPDQAPSTPPDQASTSPEQALDQDQAQSTLSSQAELTTAAQALHSLQSILPIEDVAPMLVDPDAQSTPPQSTPPAKSRNYPKLPTIPEILRLQSNSNPADPNRSPTELWDALQLYTYVAKYTQGVVDRHGVDVWGRQRSGHTYVLHKAGYSVDEFMVWPSDSSAQIPCFNHQIVRADKESREAKKAAQALKRKAAAAALPAADGGAEADGDEGGGGGSGRRIRARVDNGQEQQDGVSQPAVWRGPSETNGEQQSGPTNGGEGLPNGGQYDPMALDNGTPSFLDDLTDFAPSDGTFRDNPANCHQTPMLSQPEPGFMDQLTDPTSPPPFPDILLPQRIPADGDSYSQTHLLPEGGSVPTQTDRLPIFEDESTPMQTDTPQSPEGQPTPSQRHPPTTAGNEYIPYQQYQQYLHTFGELAFFHFPDEIEKDTPVSLVAFYDILDLPSCMTYDINSATEAARDMAAMERMDGGQANGGANGNGVIQSEPPLLRGSLLAEVERFLQPHPSSATSDGHNGASQVLPANCDNVGQPELDLSGDIDLDELDDFFDLSASTAGSAAPNAQVPPPVTGTIQPQAASNNINPASLNHFLDLPHGTTLSQPSLTPFSSAGSASQPTSPDTQLSAAVGLFLARMAEQELSSTGNSINPTNPDCSAAGGSIQSTGEVVESSSMGGVSIESSVPGSTSGVAQEDGGMDLTSFIDFDGNGNGKEAEKGEVVEKGEIWVGNKEDMDAEKLEDGEMGTYKEGSKEGKGMDVWDEKDEDDDDLDVESMVGHADEAIDSGVGSPSFGKKGSTGSAASKQRDQDIDRLVKGLKSKAFLTQETLDWFLTTKAQADSGSITLKDAAPLDDRMYQQAWKETDIYFGASQSTTNPATDEVEEQVKCLMRLSVHSKKRDQHAMMTRGVQSFLQNRVYQKLWKYWNRTIRGTDGDEHILLYCDDAPQLKAEYHIWLTQKRRLPKNAILSQRDQQWGNFIESVGSQYLLLGGKSGDGSKGFGINFMKGMNVDHLARFRMMLQTEVREAPIGRDMAGYAPLVEEVLHGILSGRILGV